MLHHILTKDMSETKILQLFTLPVRTPRPLEIAEFDLFVGAFWHRQILPDYLWCNPEQAKVPSTCREIMSRTRVDFPLSR